MSLNPVDNGITSNSQIYEWRQYLKQQLLIQRNYRSDLSGKLLTSCEMHEGIVTRADVPKSVKWQYLIFHPINSFLLLSEEHRPAAPDREWCILKSYERYGKEYVQRWFYEELPWKVIPFRLPE